MFMKQTKVWLTLTIVLSLLALASACSKSETPTNEPTPTSGSTAYAPKGNEGTVTGVISYTGTPPVPKKIDTSSDAACGSKNPNLSTEDNVVTDGKLANVFVYVKEGTLTDGGKKIGDFTFATPATPIVMDQDGCHYRPHVLGAMVNQDIEIKNSDPTTHNVNFTPKSNPGWNQSQPQGAPPLKHKLARAEVLVPVKCNQHPWMKSYIGVMKHPFFAVSAENGTFTITGLPPGTYTVVAWHEGGQAGTEKTMQVTVPASGSAKADFAFGEATASAPSSLPMMPAVEFPMIVRH